MNLYILNFIDKKIFRTNLQKKYMIYRKNKQEIIPNLANDIFRLYFESFEILYAYSLSVNVKYYQKII